MDSLAILYPFNPAEGEVHIDRKEFSIGRAKNASYDIKDVSISRNHCVLCLKERWTLCDKSSGGTWLNGQKLNHNFETALNDGDHIRLGENETYKYIFCVSGRVCSNSCWTRVQNSKLMAQRRRLFEYNASVQKDGLTKSILEKQHDRRKLEQQQKILWNSFNEQLLELEERNRQLHRDLENQSASSGSNLLEERERLGQQLIEEKRKLEELHNNETTELACKISAFEAAESELKKENQDLLERLDREKQQFETRLEDERKVLEAKLAEQAADHQRLAAEKSRVEEALRLKDQEMQKKTHLDQEQQQQRQVEQEKEKERLSKEKLEFERRLEELQKLLEEKERLAKAREKEFQERNQELKAQEEQRERERKEQEAKMEADFMARKQELENLERERQEALDRRKEEVARELQEREAELKRKAEEREKEIEEQREKALKRLQKELEEKEKNMTNKLEWEMIRLQEDKVAIEMNIRGELSKKEGENAEILGKLQSELNQVKKDLDTTSSKRTLLEKQLEEASQAKEAASKSELEARKAVIENFGDLVESELQCSICSELFVVAITLNCNHTFCQLCISHWLEKKSDCPICRALVTQKSRSLVLDSFIDKMVENLSEDLKTRRKEIVEERKILAQAAAEAANPRKKRKMDNAARAVPAVQALQAVPVLNGNVPLLVPVTTTPVGARIYHLPPHGPTVQSTIDLTGSSPGRGPEGGRGDRGLSAAQAAAIAARAPTLGPPIVISSESEDGDDDCS